MWCPEGPGRVHGRVGGYANPQEWAERRRRRAILFRSPFPESTAAVPGGGTKFVWCRPVETPNLGFHGPHATRHTGVVKNKMYTPDANTNLHKTATKLVQYTDNIGNTDTDSQHCIRSVSRLTLALLLTLAPLTHSLLHTPSRLATAARAPAQWRLSQLDRAAPIEWHAHIGSGAPRAQSPSRVSGT